MEGDELGQEKSMTPQEINEAIAIANAVAEPPDYHGSLDAIVPVVRSQPAETKRNTLKALAQITGDLSSFALATPAQWCEAFLHAKGLWK